MLGSVVPRLVVSITQRVTWISALIATTSLVHPVLLLASRLVLLMRVRWLRLKFKSLLKLRFATASRLRRIRGSKSKCINPFGGMSVVIAIASSGLFLMGYVYTLPLPSPLKNVSHARMWPKFSCSSMALLGPLPAGWSVVAITIGVLGETQLVGCLCGSVCTTDELPEWFGASSATNIDAELQAMVVAQLAALSMESVAPVVIRPDLQFSHDLADRRVGARKDDVLAAMLASLGSLMHPGITVQEVRGHVGNPWNELADVIAKAAASQGLSCGRFPLQAARQLAQSKLLREWMWWGLAPQQHKAAFPAECAPGEWQVSPCQASVVSTFSSPLRTSEQAVQVKCSVASVNVCSARDTGKSSGKTKGARAARLDQQLHSHGIAIAGIQESRMPQGQRITTNYSVLASGHQQCGKSLHFGTELWVSRTIPIAEDSSGAPVFLGRERPTVLHADPRRLFVRFDGALAFTVIVAHAPCLSDHNEKDEVKAWWHEFATLCQKFDDGNGVICCIDANAPLASHQTSLYGCDGAEKPNKQMQWFQSFLDQVKFAVPATLGFHTGPHHTWTHPKQKQLRRDYVLVSASWLPFVSKSRTLQDFDTGLFHVDHVPAILDLAGVAVGKIRRGARIDAALAQSDAGRTHFQEALQTLPMPVWSVNVDQHSDYLHGNIMNIACQVFRSKIKKPRERPQLTEATINFINFKRQVLQMVRCASPEAAGGLLEQLRAIEKDVRRKVRDDQSIWYDDWVKGIQASGELHDHKQVFQKLTRLGRKKTGAPRVRPLPMLKTPEGGIAKDYKEVQEIFCRQFAELEAGIHVDDETLRKQNKVPSPLSQEELDLTFVPSLWQIQRTLMRFKTGKAPGKSGLTVELFRAGGLPMLHHFLPLMVKAVVTTHEPLGWKGGRLFALYKGKGDPSDPSSFRSIFLSELAAKLLHAMVRTRLEVCWERQIREIQHGGRKRHSTDTAHHIVHAHMAWARAQKVSSAVVFIDLKAAFYSVFRQSLVGGDWKAEEMQFLLSKLHIAEADWPEIIQTTRSDDATPFLGDHVRKMLQDMFTATFFEMTDVGEKIATHRGTRPGDPVGDILFNMLFRLILKDVRTDLQQHPEAEWVGAPADEHGVFNNGPIPSKAFAEIAFVDDVAYIYAQTPEQTISLVQNILSAFKDAAAKRGLRVNFAEGKTEVLVNLVGPGSRASRTRLWHTMQGKVPIVSETETCKVQLVHHYKHLGSFVQEKAITTKDRNCRLAEARKAAGVLVRPFFAKPFLKMATKTTVFEALVSSRHSYNVHTWSWVSEDELSKWASGLKDIVRKLLGFTSEDVPWYHLPTEDLYALAGMDAPMDALHAARLRYVRRAIQVAPPILWQLLWQTAVPQSWLEHLAVSFRWFGQHYPYVATDYPTDLPGWLTMVALDPGWKGRVKTTLKACRQFRMRQAQGRKWTMSIAGTLRSFGCGSDEQSVPDPNLWTCGQCGSTFASRRALAMHASKLHGYKPEAKYFVLGADCIACGKRYFTRQRNLRHFQTSTKCAERLLSCFTPAREEEVATADQLAGEQATALIKRGWTPMKSFSPPLQLPWVSLPPCFHESVLGSKKW